MWALLWLFNIFIYVENSQQFYYWKRSQRDAGVTYGQYSIQSLFYLLVQFLWLLLSGFQCDFKSVQLFEHMTFTFWFFFGSVCVFFRSWTWIWFLSFLNQWLMNIVWFMFFTQPCDITKLHASCSLQTWIVCCSELGFGIAENMNESRFCHCSLSLSIESAINN